MILPKRPGADDEVSDADGESTKLIFVSISARTSLYKNPDGMSRYQKQGDFNYHFSNMPYTI
jgi:transglutaminase 1